MPKRIAELERQLAERTIDLRACAEALLETTECETCEGEKQITVECESCLVGDDRRCTCREERPFDCPQCDGKGRDYRHSKTAESVLARPGVLAVLEGK